MSEVLESRKEAKRVIKNDEAIKRAEFNATKSGLIQSRLCFGTTTKVIVPPITVANPPTLIVKPLTTISNAKKSQIIQKVEEPVIIDTKQNAFK